MTTDLSLTRYPTPALVRTANITGKAGLLLLLFFALLFPDAGNMRDKAAGLRAVAYPMLAFSVPAIWALFWKDRASFPWLADLLVTITCFTDILGNRLDLYDAITWFDDWMHFMNTGLLAMAVVLLTMHRSSTFMSVLERSLAVGATGAIAWEIAEYYAFISGHTERGFAYTDTLGDLGLGTFGAVVAAMVVHGLWRNGRLLEAAPQLEHRAVLSPARPLAGQ